MSISYLIVFNTNLGSKDVGSLIEKLGFHNDPSNSGRSPIVPTLTYFKGGLLVDLIEANELTKDIYNDELKINVTYKIVISVPNDISYKDDDTRMMLDLLAEINSYCDDLAFLFNGEKVLSLKTKGKLELDSGSEFWTEENQMIIQERCGNYRYVALPVI